MHFEYKIAAQWRHPGKTLFRPQEKSKSGIAQRFFFAKCPKNAHA